MRPETWILIVLIHALLFILCCATVIFWEDFIKPYSEKRARRHQEKIEKKTFRDELTAHGINLPSLLNRFRKNNGHADLDLNRFELRRTTTTGYISSDHSFYADGSTTFLLCYKIGSESIVVAGIGFIDATKQNTLVVTQIQGVRGKREYLAPLKWERMLLALVTEWARAKGARVIKVLAGCKNSWFSDSSKKEFYMRYDITARRSGFRLEEGGEHYALIL